VKAHDTTPTNAPSTETDSQLNYINLTK
jgi:hypothetical protein